MEQKEQRNHMSHKRVGGKTLGAIISLVGGFGLGLSGKMIYGNEVMDMINDLKYSKGLGYMIPAILGTLETYVFKGNVGNLLLNISLAEIGYVLGCNLGKNSF